MSLFFKTINTHNYRLEPGFDSCEYRNSKTVIVQENTQD